MPELSTKETVKSIVDQAEETLNKCFNMLMDIKHASDTLGDAIMNFQPLLADCLYDLMGFYQKLQAEKDFIITQKSVWEQALFKEAITANAKHLKAVKEVITIGKTLGDAFSWFFYSKNRSELDIHFEHPSTGLFVAGIGGKGEIEFIKNNQNLDGLFVVYHGITDMLRVGDFSLYANGIGIVGIGELKSQREGDRISVTANITSKVSIKTPTEAVNSELSFDERMKLLQKSFPSLPKQMEAQDKLMKAEKSEHSSNFYADYEYDAVNSLSPKSPIALNADNSLLLCAAWSKHVSLFDILSDDEHVDAPDGLSNYAIELMKPESPYNEAVISEIDTRMFFPRMPILWWKISDELCRDIYFKRVSISTVFNPAKLLRLFVDKGFRVVSIGKTQDIKLEKVADGKRMEFGSLQMYMDLIHHSMMRTDAVFAIVERVIEAFESGKIPLGTKVDMHIHLNNFGTMPEE